MKILIFGVGGVGSVVGGFLARAGHDVSLLGRPWHLDAIEKNGLVITGIKIPTGKSQDDSVYLPGRNIIFLSKAACFAAMKGISVIEIGVLKGNPFPDSTRSFFKKISAVLSMGLSTDIEVKAPFHKMQKGDVIAHGRKLPLESTFSCLNPKGYEHCGECNKCVERKKAFFAAGVFDKTKYKKPGI